MNKVSYVIDTKYVSGIITEYDVKKSNISVLYSVGAISKELYNKLYDLPKLNRNIYIGKLQRDDKYIHKILAKGLIDYKDKFYKVNNIHESDIVSIHNDAIFLLNRTPSVTKFDNVEFIIKGRYTSFFKLFSLEIYYNLDAVTGYEYVSIKGINDKILVKHNDYFLELLNTVFYTLQLEGLEDAINVLKKFSISYNDRTLDIGYYREFNANSLFKLNNKYYTDFCSNDYISIIDISYNYNIIRELFSILSSIHFSKI